MQRAGGMDGGSPSPSPYRSPSPSPVPHQVLAPPRPSLFAPVIIVPMSVTPTVLADHAAAFNEFVPLHTPPPRYNDRFRRPSKRNLRHALDRLETAHGPLASYFPTTPSSPTPPLPAPQPSPNAPAPRPHLRHPPSYEDARLTPPSYPSHSHSPSPSPHPHPFSTDADASTSSLLPGWDKHPVLHTPEPPASTKRPRRSLLDILMPGLNRRRIFAARRQAQATQ
ncbi:hypothetical protein CALCODRAFT_487209 [Calocera cornea HHB12733]|uniref:Uncharacterized protein n=1 Tax=Calocera cornea HHB12733 TaxID=1353952 RepID=A0A165D9W5_9BASI|nr:hypothetical protein CALCODRAFT_487209 [Calocera cornea HHB12733]